MANQYKNKVVYNGTTLIDLSQDTVTSASHILKGYVGHLADGVQVTGTAESGGGSVTWETKSDQSITIVADNPNYFVWTYTEALGANETYRITWGENGTQYICETVVDPIDFTQDGFYLGNASIADSTYEDTGEPFMLYRNSGTRMVGCTNHAAGSWRIKIEKQVTSSATLITKTISSNGTYNASDDGADGYDSVTVNVPSGLVYETGTYTAASDGNPTISFANTHSAAPAIIVFMDVSTSFIGTTAGTQYGFFDYEKLFGTKLKTSNTLQRDGAYQWARVGGSNASTALGAAILADTTTQVTSSGFTPNFNSNSNKCKSGQTYKWIAIWK